MATIVDTLENVLAFRVTGLDTSARQIDRFFNQVQAQSRRAGQRADFGAQFGAGALGQLDQVTGNLDRIQRAERLVGGAAIAGAAGVGVLINRAAHFEQIQIAFEGLLGSSEAARAELTKLRDFANHSPFNFTQVAEGSQMLLSAGASANDLIPILTALGNANARSGRGQEAYNRSLLATSQILSKGRLQGEELLQLQEAGVPLNAVLKDLGVSYDQVGQGAVTAARFTQSLIRVMTTGDFAGAMEKQGKTLNGTFSTLQDSIEQLETSMGQGLAPAAITVVKALTSVVDWANALPEPVKNAAGVVGGVLVAGAVVAWGWLKKLEFEHKRLLDRMIEVTLQADKEAKKLEALSGKGGGVGAGTPGTAGGGRRGGLLNNPIAQILASMGLEWAAGAMGETNWNTKTPMGGALQALQNVGKRSLQGAGIGLFGGPEGALAGAALGGIFGAGEDIFHGLGFGNDKKPETQTADQKMIELLQKQLDETKKQTGMMASGSASVSTSEVALYRQMAGRRVVQYTR